MQDSEHQNIVCQRIRLSGIVQGVGLRSLVLRIAKELQITGWVRNDSKGVEIEADGPPLKVQELIRRLQEDAPRNARIDTITSSDQSSVSGSDDFFILESRGGRSETTIGQDTAICRNCLNEMFDPGSRRWRYAFTNCNDCGPRYSLCDGLPFDRKRTSFSPFTMCNKCRAEYKRLSDPHFHAEATVCPKCGPQLSFLDATGNPVAGDPIALAHHYLTQGKILAIKGSGCFHLVCDAKNIEAVRELRRRKKREVKPFPIMFANVLSATRHVLVSVGEPGSLVLPERPIVLLNKRSHCDELFPEVAPNLPWLGVTLPFTPTYYLLFHEALGRPTERDWLDKTQEQALVLTSANTSREPPVINNDEALLRLNGIADAFLMHNYDILARCDDSIARSGPGGLQVIRRARGYTPRPIKFPQAGPTILAVGADAKNTVCLVRGDDAFISQHVGDLANVSACAYFEETIHHLLKVLETPPALVAHDLNRESISARFAVDFANKLAIPKLAVQHRHAHIAAILAEHNISDPIPAVVLDGGGTGVDGKILGGDLMLVDGARFNSLGNLAPITIASRQEMSRSPWLLASAVLHALGRNAEIEKRFSDFPEAKAVAGQLISGENCLQASSFGRLIEAVAGLLGISYRYQFRDQAALWLEGAAKRYGDIKPLNNAWTIENGSLNLLPLLDVLADEKNAEKGSALFHATLAAALTDWISSLTPASDKIAAGGNCMQNQTLARLLKAGLAEQGKQLIESRMVPPNDAGLSLGQAWVAQQYLLGRADKVQENSWHPGLADRRSKSR